MSFASLKKNDLSKLTKALEDLSRNSNSTDEDDRFWYPDVDKVGNGYAVIRFLPAAEADGETGLPWIRKFSHSFQGPGGWMIEECPTTIQKECPVCKYNKELWNSGVEANKDLARKQKRKVNYIANIYVISDPATPANEKKVKLFRFGTKIFDKINEAMNPQFKDEKPLNPFHLYEGANLKLKIRNVENYRNYDKSEFDRPEQLLANDAEMEQLWKSEYSLSEFIHPKNYKDAAVLKQRLDKALGSAEVSKSSSTVVAEKTPVVKKSTIEDDLISKKKVMNDEDDDDMSYFQKLADDN